MERAWLWNKFNRSLITNANIGGHSAAKPSRRRTTRGIWGSFSTLLDHLEQYEVMLIKAKNCGCCLIRQPWSPYTRSYSITEHFSVCFVVRFIISMDYNFPNSFMWPSGRATVFSMRNLPRTCMSLGLL